MTESEVLALATKWGRHYGVPPRLLVEICRVESNFNPAALGDGGNSFGLMQINVNGAVAAWIALALRAGVPLENWMNPDVNMKVAAWFFGTEIPAALKRGGHADTVRNRVVAYNAGASRVGRPNALLPAPTKAYLEKLSARGVNLSLNLGGGSSAGPSFAGAGARVAPMPGGGASPAGAAASLVMGRAAMLAPVAALALWGLLKALR